ncbi:hypothetical protein ASG67_10410 [Sphingomonas sp. Leaf339]|uniref:PEPxxWA-CTERM sorting domain-containing protein n=1 Tax=Sphingomonas sp. Leaf339 TaxID=1736343 RepID=UPI0006F1F1C5|nr:PEPxxWA-CTERM sorting domain-containing protein [Sphingomonas sp. Leaf339]KQU53213.1 hypothetical protein ASG67_10410 [Sphingomonas sp. Leaf339]
MKKFIVAALTATMLAGSANAAPIIGSFSLASFSGNYVSGTASTATGLDFGDAFGGTGNGYGTNGSALVGNAQGSFAGLNGVLASVSDIALGAGIANPYVTNPFISFGGASNIAFAFANASLTRSPLGTSITITGTGTFTNGVAADATSGTFSLATSSVNGTANSVSFTFTSNAVATASAVPETSTWAMMTLGFGAMGFAMRRKKINTRIRLA